MMVGSGNYSYEVLEDWAKLPLGWSIPDASGVDVDSTDQVYIFHRGRHPVLVLSRDGDLLKSWGDGLFSVPHSIRIGPDGMVYCVDRGDHTVRKLTAEGELLLTLGTPGRPSETGAVSFEDRVVKRAAGPFNMPTDVAFGASGDLFVSDGYGNARIHRFSKDGELLDSWGQPGEGPAQFHLPHAVWMDGRQRLLVADTGNNRIQFLALDGRFITEWKNVPGPNAIFTDSKGNVFVLERNHDPKNRFSRITIRSPQGEVLTSWGGREACDPGSFWSPHMSCMDSRGDIYVGEITIPTKAPSSCHSLQKFVKRKG